jgi:MFS family permease
MRHIGKAAITALPHVSEETRKRSVSDLFRPGLIAMTLICAAAYFFHITTFYYILKWVPFIVAQMGFPASSAGGVLTWYMAGGATGGAVLGLLTMRFGLKGLTMAVLVLSTVLVAFFGQTPPDLSQLGTVCFFAGFFTNAAIVGLYAIFAHAFPTHVRAAGTGFAIGVGRGGSVLAPAVAGFLFAAGYGVPAISILMSLGSLVAAGVLVFLKLTPDVRDEQPVEQAAAMPANPSRA